MKVLDIVLDIKDNAARIGDAAGDDQPEASGIDVLLEGIEDEDDHPAHHQIGDQREELEASGVEEFECDAYQGDTPFDAEDGPPLSAAYDEQHDRRIGTGDEEVDGTVIELLKEAF